ncbi:NADH-quinone oxidoreductase subunit A [Thermodesulfatator autotrophicus]|uniref:NADH-quinone oxidoreductase subunit A n=1 Tax=Thermodesulfatator autotrophicus TaxID=1795632 RepID=A0A177E7G3_9BACT|nr:NADH-quinone oxidoreductase subunit A [Thermodesulfatator autotrophicus]OAG27728.1 NADH-quinone oxidoreductase subunit A [Thermodesulfatator autotrophicus]
MEISLSLKYIPILITALIVFVIGLAMVIINQVLGPKRPYSEKYLAYECGLPPTGETRHRFDIKFYAIAILFAVFDVEAVFLYPWAITFDQIGFFAYIEMVVFIALLLVAYFYAWIRGGFQWD